MTSNNFKQPSLSTIRKPQLTNYALNEANLGVQMGMNPSIFSENDVWNKNSLQIKNQCILKDIFDFEIFFISSWYPKISYSSFDWLSSFIPEEFLNFSFFFDTLLLLGWNSSYLPMQISTAPASVDFLVSWSIFTHEFTIKTWYFEL